MQFYERLMLENQAWSEEMRRRDPDYFSRLQRGQTPEAFWLGCSDSRVPPEQLCNASPGDLFIHRNVANIAAIEENGFLSALEYAISALSVRYIIVCGHEGCGGVGAACAGHASGMPHIDAHLAPLVSLYESEGARFDPARDHESRVNTLVRRNVEAQIQRLAALPLVTEADWPPTLIGLIYRIDRGVLERICEHAPAVSERPVARRA